MKTSGSLCPLHQLSIICFKCCSYLRSCLARLIQAVWLSVNVPHKWKKACTILIHKKCDTKSPENFRPITIKSVPLKVFTSSLCNAIFTFLFTNNFIKHKIQKGFTPHISGTCEHTAQMAYIINEVRTKQRSRVVTLLGFKNAFGEVHHNLIQCVLGYYHIPDHIQNPIHKLQNIYYHIYYLIAGVLWRLPYSLIIYCFNTFV